MVIDTDSTSPSSETPPSSPEVRPGSAGSRPKAPRKPRKKLPAPKPLPDGNSWFRGRGSAEARKGKRAPAHLAKRSMLRVRLTDSEMKLAKRIAAKLGQSMGYLVREFLKTYAKAIGLEK